MLTVAQRGVVLFLFIVTWSSFVWPNPVTFNDEALLGAVKTQWETATGLTLSDPPQDMELADARFTTLDAHDLGISDLTGLQACTSLTDLNVGMNQISDITPLSGLIGLVKLDVGLGIDLLENETDDFDYLLAGTNLIADIAPLAGLINLEYLSLIGNTGITSIAAISTMDNLTTLWLGSNPLASFSPLSGVADTLMFLAIINNGLTNADIPDINSLTNLEGLIIIGEMNLTDISGLTTITPSFVFALILSPVTNINIVAAYTTLQALDVIKCQITAMPDLSGLTSLQEANFSENQLTDISGLSGNTSLQDLDLNQNQIGSISALESCTGLIEIDLSGNLLTDIQPLLDNTNASNFEWVRLSDNSFAEGTPFCDEDQLDQLKALTPSVEIESNAVCGPSYNLTISVNGTGSTFPALGVTAIAQNTWANVNAYPISGSGQAFSEWTGDVSSTNMDVQIFMDSDKSVTANFILGNWTLTINRTGAPEGSVWPDPGVYSYLDGRTAHVSVNNHADAYFNGWSGDASGYTNNVQLTMDGAKTVTADFVSSGYQLTLGTSGGQGGFNGFGGNGPFYLATGASFDLQAQSYNINHFFDHWEGDIPAGADIHDPTLPIVMDSNRDLTAVFTAIPQALLTVNVSGMGSGTTSLAPGVHSIDLGSSTWIQAIPDEGSAFDHWEGDIGSANPYQDSILITMDQNRTVTAIFVPAVWTLTVQKTGNGATSPVPGNYGFVNGVQKFVYANLMDGGDAFDRWTGDLMPGASATETTQELTMNQNRTVTAEFVPGDWTLTIATEGPVGGSCLPLYPGVGTYAYLNNRTAEVFLNLCPGVFFAGWTGDAGGLLPNLSIPMNGNKSITAHFTDTGFSLTTAVSGQGWMTPPPGTFYYASGAAFTLIATPWSGWVFDHWEGDVPAGENPNDASIDITMNQNRTLTAVMTQLPAYTLTITVLGPGITSPAAGIHEIEAGITQYITALPNSGAALDHWEGDIGDADPTQNRIGVLMDQDRSITAVFTTADWTLTINTSGNGSTYPYPGVYGFLDGVQTCVSKGLVAGGGAFSNWAGDLSLGANPSSESQCVTMDQNRTLTAEFVPGDWTLTLAMAGAGSGNLNPGTGVFSFLDGQRVDVIAGENSGAYFAGWSGDYTGTESHIQLVMDSNKSLTATFDTSGYTLTVGMEGQGWLNIPPGAYLYAAGTEVTLYPYGELGNWDFDYWSGNLPSGADPENQELTLAMDQDRSIIAHFVEDVRTLTVIIEGEGVTNPSGSPYPGTVHSYSPGQYVFVSAELGNEAYAFKNWSGDTGSLDTDKWFLELIMDQDRTIVAHFEPAAWHLTINYTGIGSIFPETGTYAFPQGAHFEVIANIIDGGEAFLEWTGDVQEDMDPHQFDMHLTMDRDRTVTAVFTPGDFTLTMNPIEGGGTAWYQPSAGIYSYVAGQTAWMEARPDAGMYWGGWHGDINTYDKIYHFVMDGNKVITPHVTTTGYTLSLATAGAPGATAPEGSIKYSAGATPLIHAIETGAGFFDHWSGNLPTGMDPLDPDPVVLMDQNRSLIANFVQADWYLYIQAQGNGTTDPAPDLYWYRDGEPFSITATPGADTVFLHWMGNIPEGQNPSSTAISGTMTQNREIIAVFVPVTVTVPDLSGKTQAEAETALMSAGLTMGAVTQEYSSTVPAGQVISQAPAAQTSVAYGSVVSIVISLGSCYTSIPNVEGLGTAEAQAALTTANLTTGAITYELSETVPEGRVISQNPVSGLVVECGTAVDLVVSGTSPEGGEEGEGEGSGEGESDCHTADQDCNNLVNLSELLRVIQFFNSGGYHCESGTEDGYAPGPASDKWLQPLVLRQITKVDCRPHASDYNTQDWLINLSELLRIIQFFNSGGYHYCPGENTEDGFCPGSA